MEAEWNVKLPPQPPTVVEDWHDEPPAINLVDVTAAEVDVFTMDYEVTTSRLTSRRMLWKRKTKDEARHGQ
ncbi:MAG: hypothetical protein SFU86_14610 [Pirellulaceae bacterium]|nr:hypothetical protein [Pirellulaceae bacterium]